MTPPLSSALQEYDSRRPNNTATTAGRAARVTKNSWRFAGLRCCLRSWWSGVSTDCRQHWPLPFLVWPRVCKSLVPPTCAFRLPSSVCLLAPIRRLAFGRAASGGASALEPPRATGVGSLSDGCFFPFSFFVFCFLSFLSLRSGRDCDCDCTL